MLYGDLGLQYIRPVFHEVHDNYPQRQFHIGAKHRVDGHRARERSKLLLPDRPYRNRCFGLLPAMLQTDNLDTDMRAAEIGIDEKKDNPTHARGDFLGDTERRCSLIARKHFPGSK